MSERGKFIVIEGGEHVGKTTQTRILANKIGALSVREPGGTPIGESLRSLLLDKEVSTLPKTEVLLFAGQRAELMGSVIEPALLSGQHVVSDRSWISGAAYQCARGGNYQEIKEINRYALGDFFMPDSIIILDADPEIVAKRVKNSGDYFEDMDEKFHLDVRQNFLEFGQDLGAVILDATLELKTVSNQIRETIKNNLNI